MLAAHNNFLAHSRDIYPEGKHAVHY